VLDIHNQLCSARLLMEWVRCKSVMAEESPLGIFLFVSERVVIALLSALFLKCLFFNVCETPQHFLHLLSTPSDSYVQFLSIFLPDSNVRWTLRWSMLSFLGMVTIPFSAVRGPLLFPSSWLCIILFSNHHCCLTSS